jgi:uncharacterized membrane protein AbrB (regulator of aidB expression)
VFIVQVLGLRGMPESTWATEPGALHAHALMAQKYREQVAMVEAGTPPFVADGIL